MSKLRSVWPSELESWGHDLRRPECVVTTQRGDIYVPRWPRDPTDAAFSPTDRPGVTVIRSDGAQEDWLASTNSDLRPNGIALMPDGSFLIANLGADGGIWRLTVDGAVEPFLT